jgi:hypothetical protein
VSAFSGILKVGDISVSVCGIKLVVSASNHAGVIHGRARELKRELALEIEQLLRKTEPTDITTLDDGASILGKCRAARKATHNQLVPTRKFYP